MLCDIGRPGTIDELEVVLRRGGVVIMPCDTIYGLVGIAPDTGGRIRRIKGRDSGKSFIQLIGEAAWLGRFAVPPIPAELSGYWPGPLTLIVRTGEGETVAVRVPADPVLRELLRRLDVPLYSTSVNASGQPELNDFETLRSEFGSRVDLLARGAIAGPAVPSTILDVSIRPYRVLRQGAVRVPPELLIR